MKNTIRTAVLAVAALALAGASHAGTCMGGSMAAYDALGAGGCTLTSASGITLTFSAFSFTDSGANAPTASDVTVSPTGGTLAFQFNSSWVAIAPPSSLQDATIQFTVASSSPVIDDVTAALIADFCGGGGSVSLTESVYSGATAGVGSLGGLNATCTGANVSNGPQTLNFAPQSEITVVKDLGLNSGAAGSASVSEFSDAISVTPEPGSLMLLGSGLIGLAGALRRKLVS
jgi:hypothetical protein